MNLTAILRAIAEDAAEKGEYHPEEHTCWIAALRIEQLESMIAGNNDPQLLHEIATRLWRKQQHEQIMAADRPISIPGNLPQVVLPPKVEGNGTG